MQAKDVTGMNGVNTLEVEDDAKVPRSGHYNLINNGGTENLKKVRIMKKILLVLMTAFMIFMFVGAASADLTTGLVAYYPFNGNANDESGNGHNGTVFGPTLTLDRFGNPDSAYSFDGVNDYIQIPFAADLHPSIFSLSAWFNTTDAGKGTIITSDPDSSYCNHGYELGVLDGKGWFFTDPTSNCGDGKEVSSNNLLNDGIWHHMVAIFDGSQMMLYVDGILQNQITLTTTYSKPNSFLRIGMTNRSIGQEDQIIYLGSIDEIRIYNQASTLINEKIKIKRLSFIRKTDSGPVEIKEISYDEPFYIKVEYNSEPEEKMKTVTLDWGDGADEKRPITVTQQKDKKIYLSDAIYAKRPE